MKRFNKTHRVKTEMPETSTSYNREQEVHDLAYYIHDRVELMHQVFSVLKYKQLKAMAPACVRNISIDDLQELCTEELLGISSKRLCAILDGAEPPSDTESSSPSPPPELETISLDSISSDEEILSQSSKKKKHKHRRRDSKSKRKKSKDQDEGDADRSKASRAGLTVLELLELQARARAIRAQLQKEQTKPPAESTAVEPPHSSDNEVEIKEEPAEVVEISSDDEKPRVEDLDKMITQEKEPEPQPSKVTKKINDLVITVPQKTTQKIKLNRPKTTPVTTTDKTNIVTTDKTDKPQTVAVNEVKDNKSKKDKPKRKKKSKVVRKEDDDNDEITLQLSDTEKMDLLEDLDRKTFDNVSSDTSSDSSDSVPSGDDKETEENLKGEEITSESMKDSSKRRTEIDKQSQPSKSDSNVTKSPITSEVTNNSTQNNENTDEKQIKDNNDSNTEQSEKDNIIITEKLEESNVKINSHVESTAESEVSKTAETDLVTTKEKDQTKEVVEEKETEKQLSDGELSDRESSEVEAVDLKPEVVCISDEEGSKSKKKKKEKKAKKDKKSKKEKKTKKSDFREGADQNFYKNSDSLQVKEVVSEKLPTEKEPDKTIDNIESINKVDLTVIDITKTNDEIDISNLERIRNESKSTTNTNSNSYSDDDIEEIYETLELSSDSEIECTILSKEPTALEIEALSAKIDEIDRVEVITEEEIRQYENREDRLEEIENISWKDRYLDSKKVKRVLNTANILNALRKKNRDLKKKLAESKVEIAEEKEELAVEKTREIEVLEGSIEHYNTLEGSTKYVAPVKEVSGDLKKDAKFLLKMYKKLLKFNDINKEDDPSRKKKKKKRNKKDKEHNSNIEQNDLNKEQANSNTGLTDLNKEHNDSNIEHKDLIKEQTDLIKEQNHLNKGQNDSNKDKNDLIEEQDRLNEVLSVDNTITDDSQTLALQSKTSNLAV